jgi:hypothetical protein
VKRTRVSPLLLPALLLAVPAVAQQRNIVANAGFEIPRIPPTDADHLLSFFASSSFGGWVVDAGDVEILGHERYQPAAGLQSLDMNGVSVGTIHQDLVTVVGMPYELSFALAGNWVKPSDKSVRVWWGAAGGALDLVGSFTARWDPSKTAFDMHWETLTRSGLVASSPTTRLLFESTTIEPEQSDAGAFLDQVSVTPAPEPSSAALLAGGALLILGYARRARRTLA